MVGEAGDRVFRLRSNSVEGARREMERAVDFMRACVEFEVPFSTFYRPQEKDMDLVIQYGEWAGLMRPLRGGAQ